eukprot:CAMPEP_0194373328 /NCGR_PEP_ID=MMETSP0174-20130528/21753_1 /TAXON_ID=216777 /ORGANISM="Proboscia alata, Strain PI-D3" /LENGTH=51 /DNA_ID=CAMNT_0039152331 /DNA_START=57 /DNA_END=209 /DNA_ORIENTATION=+
MTELAKERDKIAEKWDRFEVNQRKMEETLNTEREQISTDKSNLQREKDEFI